MATRTSPEQHRAHQRAYAARHPERIQERRRRYYLRRKFDLTPEQYADMLVAQDGRCAICHEPETHRTRTGALAPLSIDHDHETGRVRGLLCDACNGTLGRMKDSPALLRAAADYLERA